MTELLMQAGDSITIRMAPAVVEVKNIRIVFQRLDNGNLLRFLTITDESGDNLDLLGWTVNGEYETLDLTITVPTDQLSFPLDAPKSPVTDLDDCACGGSWKVGHKAGCPKVPTAPLNQARKENG